MAGEERSKRLSIADSFSGSRNSPNFLRLVLALTVISSHSLALGGSVNGAVSAEDVLNTTPGQVAVFGFFGISGFLIARSAERNHFGRYLWQRFLRIFPGYWVCLLVTGFVIGVIAWGHDQSPTHCGLSCYFTSSTGPLQYFIHNADLRLGQPDIAGTPRHVPLSGVWNVSLWTLQYEFACYLLVGVLAVVGLLKRRPLVVALAGVVWVVAAAFCFTRTTLHYSETGFDEARLLGLVPLFLAGTLVYLYREKIPDSGWLAFGCVAVFVACLWLPFGNDVTFSSLPTVTAAVVASPLLAYPMIWLGIHLPFHRIAAHNDYSYGVYAHASPVQQLLAIWGVQRLECPPTWCSAWPGPFRSPWPVGGSSSGAR